MNTGAARIYRGDWSGDQPSPLPESVDPDRRKPDNDPGLAGPVHLANVGAAILGADPVGEGIVGIGPDLGAGPNFERPVGVGGIDEEERHLGRSLQILDL